MRSRDRSAARGRRDRSWRTATIASFALSGLILAAALYAPEEAGKRAKQFDVPDAILHCAADADCGAGNACVNQVCKAQGAVLEGAASQKLGDCEIRAVYFSFDDATLTPEARKQLDDNDRLVTADGVGAQQTGRQSRLAHRPNGQIIEWWCHGPQHHERPPARVIV